MNEQNKNLNNAKKAYERGDFVHARTDARTVLDNKTADDAQNQKAQHILRAIATDPIATISFGVTLFVLLFISIKYLL